MRRARLSLLTMSAVIVSVGAGLTMPASSSAAVHDTTFPTIVADLNGDGIPDHATLGAIGDATTRTCTVTVRLGRPNGTFGPPAVHTYTSPVTSPPSCPDVGVAVKLGNHKRFDLVTGFNFGFGEVLVLHDFRPAGLFQGVIQPDVLRTADFNGDGRQDVIEISGEEGAVTSLINTRHATLVPGPVHTCASHPQYVLADFNGDGGQDMLIFARCLFRTVGVSVQVLFGNGQSPVTLLSSRELSQNYTVFAIDLDYDGVPDVGVISSLNGTTSVSYFHNDGRGNFTPVPGP